MAEDLRELFAGQGIKKVGYLITVVGIFFSLEDKDTALVIVVIGVFLVILGWFMVYRGWKRSGTDQNTKKQG